MKAFNAACSPYTAKLRFFNFGDLGNPGDFGNFF